MSQINHIWNVGSQNRPLSIKYSSLQSTAQQCYNFWRQATRAQHATIDKRRHNDKRDNMYNNRASMTRENMKNAKASGSQRSKATIVKTYCIVKKCVAWKHCPVVTAVLSRAFLCTRNLLALVALAGKLLREPSSVNMMRRLWRITRHLLTLYTVGYRVIDSQILETRKIPLPSQLHQQ